MKNDEKLVRRRITIARRRLQSAQLLLQQDFANDSLSKSYYAIFAAANAVLASEGILSKKHSGVIKLFSQHFVKTGLIEKEFSKILTKARDQREMSDYADFYDAEIEEAEEQLQEAKRFVERASNFLENKGYQLDQ